MKSLVRRGWRQQLMLFFFFLQSVEAGAVHASWFAVFAHRIFQATTCVVSLKSKQ